MGRRVEHGRTSGGAVARVAWRPARKASIRQAYRKSRGVDSLNHLPIPAVQQLKELDQRVQFRLCE
jgi:hypothetical protein